MSLKWKKKKITKFLASSSSCFTLFLPPFQLSLLFCLFCYAHWATPTTVEGSGNRICSPSRFLRTGFPHLWGLGPAVYVVVCVCACTRTHTHVGSEWFVFQVYIPLCTAPSLAGRVGMHGTGKSLWLGPPAWGEGVAGCCEKPI